MEKKELMTAIGTICLDSIEFGEMLIDAYFDVKSIPDNIQEKIDDAMESVKMEQLRKMGADNKDTAKYALRMKDIEPEVLLHISIGNYGISSWIEADAFSKEDDTMWASESIEVDLSGYMAELKTFIMKRIMEKF